MRRRILLSAAALGALPMEWFHNESRNAMVRDNILRPGSATILSLRIEDCGLRIY
jgi:hypothetical protein